MPQLGQGRAAQKRAHEKAIGLERAADLDQASGQIVGALQGEQRHRQIEASAAEGQAFLVAQTALPASATGESRTTCPIRPSASAAAPVGVPTSRISGNARATVETVLPDPRLTRQQKIRVAFPQRALQTAANEGRDRRRQDCSYERYGAKRRRRQGRKIARDRRRNVAFGVTRTALQQCHDGKRHAHPPLLPWARSRRQASRAFCSASSIRRPASRAMGRPGRLTPCAPPAGPASVSSSGLIASGWERRFRSISAWNSILRRRWRTRPVFDRARRWRNMTARRAHWSIG